MAGNRGHAANRARPQQGMFSGVPAATAVCIRTLRIACSWPEADIERDVIHVRFRGIAEIVIRKLDIRS